MVTKVVKIEDYELSITKNMVTGRRNFY